MEAIPLLEQIALEIASAIHVGLGAIGAFILCPLLVISGLWRKWRYHRLPGRIFLYVTYGIALTGLVMLLDPLFLDTFWPELLESGVLQFSEVFEDTAVQPALFLWLNIILLYLVGTGYRVWKRAHQRFAAGWIDWGLTGALAVFSLLFLGIGVYHANIGHSYGVHFVQLALLLLVFAAFDTFDYLQKDKSFIRHWSFSVHATKMIVAWFGLVKAFKIRLTSLPSPLLTKYYWEIDLLFVGLVLAVIIMNAWRRPGGGLRSRLAKVTY